MICPEGLLENGKGETRLNHMRTEGKGRRTARENLLPQKFRRFVKIP